MRAHSITRLPQDVNDFDLGYCLGLIVGEGSFSRHGRGHGNGIRLRVTLHSNDPGPIHALFKVMGGRINGPYVYERKGSDKLHHALYWILNGQALKVWLPVLLERMPPSRKRQQLLAILGLPLEETLERPAPAETGQSCLSL